MGVGGARVRYAGAVEISSSSPGSGLCCDLSLIVFGSNLLAQLTGNKGSPRPFRGCGWTLVSAGDNLKNTAEPSRAGALIRRTANVS